MSSMTHLQQGQHGTVEEDLARNFVPEVVVLTAAGGHRGHEEVRQLAELLRRELPEASFTDTAGWWPGMSRCSSGPRGRGYGARVQDGADSFVIRGGRIQAQTIYYTVLPPPGPPGADGGTAS
jgi:hypothetical protein